MACCECFYIEGNGHADECSVGAADMHDTIARLTAERDEARDCEQDGVCAAPGCLRCWQTRNLELLRERDEARVEVERMKIEVERLQMELSGEGQVIDELKGRIESGRAAHNEERRARDWLAREKERLEGELGAMNAARVAEHAIAERLREVIRTGGAAYRLERAAMGIPGGMDPDPRACSFCGSTVESETHRVECRGGVHPEELKVLAAEVLKGQTRSHVGAARTFAEYLLGKTSAT